jgi:hypothetical protein
VERFIGLLYLLPVLTSGIWEKSCFFCLAVRARVFRAPLAEEIPTGMLQWIISHIRTDHALQFVFWFFYEVVLAQAMQESEKGGEGHSYAGSPSTLPDTNEQLRVCIIIKICTHPSL